MSNILQVLGIFSAARGSFDRIYQLYEDDQRLHDRLDATVNTLSQSCLKGGRLILTGVGKSGYVAQKIAATCNSLGLPAAFLHPVEAIHGDLGMLKRDDALVMITKSGRAQELDSLGAYIDPTIPVIIISSNIDTQLATKQTRSPIVLPLVNLHEDGIRGIPAPTISVLAALALGDALGICVARRVHGAKLSAVFHTNHPGGAIGSSRDTVHSTAELRSKI
jgi:D-arabinose 5-phosphate isomerase GutQ